MQLISLLRRWKRKVFWSPRRAAPRLTGDGFYEAVIEDPDGNLIEVTT
ncbi:hypothetical protein [Mesorhizobium sp. 131-3-5]|nr:hypothetical protein [Mesorhizobium sp. 131-3-5]